MPAGLTYFFDGATEIPKAWAPRFQTGYWAPLPPPVIGYGIVTRSGVLGPSGGKGFLCAAGDFEDQMVEALLYDPIAQDWDEIEDGVWLGIHQDARPVHYIRANMTRRKYAIEVPGSDHNWLVPVALIDSPDYGLPSVERMRRGEYVRVPAPEYASLADYAQQIYEAEIGEAELPPHPFMREVTIAAIGANYALTGPELGMFGVLNDTAYDVVASILTDAPARKKKVPSDSPGTDSGEPAD